jgi:hypothetical protein
MRGPPTSASGQKRTLRLVRAMSALPPIADISYSYFHPSKTDSDDTPRFAIAPADLDQRPFSYFWFFFIQALVCLGWGDTMHMNHVRCFLALCEEGNFTRAAERCGVTQPSLTKAIKNLESKLGGKLFDRNKFETQLTELGKLVHPRMQRIDQEATYALQIAKQTKARKVIMNDR